MVVGSEIRPQEPPGGLLLPPPSLGPLGLPWAWVPLGMGPVALAPPWAWPGGLWEPLWASLGLPGGVPGESLGRCRGLPGGGSWSYSGTPLEEYSDCPQGPP